jgi:hypothetical protein
LSLHLSLLRLLQSLRLLLVPGLHLLPLLRLALLQLLLPFLVDPLLDQPLLLSRLLLFHPLSLLGLLLLLLRQLLVHPLFLPVLHLLRSLNFALLLSVHRRIDVLVFSCLGRWRAIRISPVREPSTCFSRVLRRAVRISTFRSIRRDSPPAVKLSRSLCRRNIRPTVVHRRQHRSIAAGELSLMRLRLRH